MSKSKHDKAPDGLPEASGWELPEDLSELLRDDYGGYSAGDYSEEYPDDYAENGYPPEYAEYAGSSYPDDDSARDGDPDEYGGAYGEYDDIAYDEAYGDGYDIGYGDAYDDGYDDGYGGAYGDGYDDGYGEERSPGRRQALRRCAPFFTALALMTVIAWLVPLRPTHSDLEKRDLERFPAFSVQGLFSGDWFNGISLWFSDTFPGREDWVRAQSRFEELYGDRTIVFDGALSVDNRSVDEDFANEVIAAPEPSPVPAETAAPAAADPVQESVPAEPAPEAAPEATPAPTPEPDLETGIEFNVDDALRNNSTVFIGDSGYERYALIKPNAQLYSNIMDKAAEKYNGIARVFSMPCPNSTGIMLSEKMFDQICEYGREGDAIEAFHNDPHHENYYPVNIYNALRAHNDEYLYFRTDHHWTALGAWYAYEEYCRVAGLTPVPLDQYTVSEFPGFLGYFYQKRCAKEMENNPDTVIAYAPPGDITCRVMNGGPWVERDIIQDQSAAPAGNKYLCFVDGSDKFMTVMENNDIHDDSAVLLICDSYGNPFSVYLTQNYHTVVVVSARNQYTSRIRTVSSIVEEYGIQDIIYLTELILAQQTDMLGNMQTNLSY